MRMGSGIGISAFGFGRAAIGLCMVGVAVAQQPSAAQQNAVRQNCRADYMTYCSSTPPGGRAALQCLQDNAAKLSPACGQAVAGMGGGPAPAAAAPAATPAPSATPTPAASPGAETAPPATAAPPAAAPPAPAAAAPPVAAPTPSGAARPQVMGRREELAILGADCRFDYRRFCRRVPVGGGRVIGCLVGNWARLSGACQGALASFRPLR